MKDDIISNTTARLQTVLKAPSSPTKKDSNSIAATVQQAVKIISFISVTGTNYNSCCDNG